MTGADVIVIGGGMAGVSAGCALAAELDVLVLEAEGEAPLHTTGRSAAMILPAYGCAPVRSLTAASRDSFEELTHRWDAPPLLTPRVCLYVADAEGAAALHDIPGLERVTPGEAMQLFPALRAGVVVAAGVDDTGSDIDVLAMYQAYRRGLSARGGLLVSGSRVIGLERLSSGWRVLTEDGERTCRVVVNAAGAWADRVASMAGELPLGLSPLTRSAFVSPVDAPDGFRQWPFLMDAQERFYAKPEGDALLGSPAEETPDEPCDAKPDELEVARALDALRELTTFPLRSVRTAWAGQRTFAPDRAPVVGESRPSSGFYWLAGQGGYGIQLAPAIADLLASQVLGQPSNDPILAHAVSPARLETMTGAVR